MNSQDFLASWLPAWWSPEWTLPAAALLGLLLIAVLWRVLRPAPAGYARQAHYDPAQDSFAASPPINQEQIALLHYLQAA